MFFKKKEKPININDVDYRFHGNREQIVKQIGNAVPVELAKALCLCLLKNDHPFIN